MSTFDISKYQGVVSVATFAAARAAGYERVILKAGGGDDGRYEDSCYAANRANALAAGLIVEVYWFNGTTDVVGDAQFAAALAGPGVRIWWDAENEGSMPHWAPWAVNLAGRTVQATNPSGAYMSSSVTFEDDWSPCTWMPLWVADYGASSPPAVGHWTGEALWQNTSKGSIPGIPGYVDLDVDLSSVTVASSGATTIPTHTSTLLEDDMPYILSSDAGQTLITGDHAIGFAGPSEVQTTMSSGVPTVAVSKRMHNAILAELSKKTGLPVIVGVTGDSTIYALAGEKLVPLSSIATVQSIENQGAPQITITAVERDRLLGK